MPARTIATSIPAVYDLGAVTSLATLPNLGRFDSDILDTRDVGGIGVGSFPGAAQKQVWFICWSILFDAVLPPGGGMNYARLHVQLRGQWDTGGVFVSEILENVRIPPWGSHHGYWRVDTPGARVSILNETGVAMDLYYSFQGKMV